MALDGTKIKANASKHKAMSYDRKAAGHAYHALASSYYRALGSWESLRDWGAKSPTTKNANSRIAPTRKQSKLTGCRRQL